MELTINPETLDDEVQKTKKRIRLEEKNPFIFNFFRISGFFPIKWDTKQGIYKTRPLLFIFHYICWFIWPLMGLAVAVLGKLVFNIEEDNVDHIDDVMETSLFILGFAVVPAISAYAIKLITQHLPDVLEDISFLGEVEVGFKTPMTIHIPGRKRKSLENKKAFIRSVNSHGHNRMLFFLPLLTVVVSVVAFVAAWTFGIVKAVGWDSLKREWPFYVMQFTYLLQPVITTWFCVVFVEWLRMIYETLTVEFDYHYCTFAKSVTGGSNGNVTKATSSSGITSPLDKEIIMLTGDYVDRIQEIFLRLNKGFVKFIISINVLVCLVSSVFCTMELLKGFHLIIYMGPLAIAIFHVGLICYMSNCLMDEYDRILLVLKKMIRLERRHPKLLPYNELHILRENLLESPPQVVTFGGYPIGNGFLIAMQGFILSYAMLANDIVDLQKENAWNSTMRL